jgi:hypothetical protein
MWLWSQGAPSFSRIVVQVEGDNFSSFEFHHPDRGMKKGEVGKMVGQCRRIEVIKAEMEKCVMLSTTCHRKQTLKNEDWRPKTTSKQVEPQPAKPKIQQTSLLVFFAKA